MSKLVLFVLLSLVVLESFSYCEPVSLNTANFEKTVTKGKTFVKFYTSWCGFCKKLAPTWDELSTELADTDVTVAKVNCEEQNTICDRFSVTSYPTLIFFEDGKYIKFDKSDRNLPTLKDFAVTTTPETPLPADPSKQGIEWSQNSDIEFLTTQNFGQINKGDWLVAFYGEWCGFCKRMGPEYEKVATLLKDSGVHVAKADVDKLDRETKKAFEINAVPMIRFIKDGKMYNFTYKSQPAADFVSWVKEGYKSVEPSPIPFIKDKSRKTPAGTTDPVKVLKQLPSWITDNVPSSVIEKIPVVVIEKALDAVDFVDNWFEENNVSKQEFAIGFGCGLFIFVMGFVSGRLTAPSPKPSVPSSKKNK